ncbi:hypothetical protein A2U01_0014909 [Trifolium medium]|uniref:Uncharacterized protein n=1 Tax=Trifolium medium TaxID=97028 RepID=A0A392N482_9FABA|nr:hypothetical protein [Trifolium medium]
MSLNQKGEALMLAKMRKENQKYIDEAKASWKTWKNPKCETNIDTPVATTDMGPGDELEKISGEKRKHEPEKIIGEKKKKEE